jgi:hypothetical protein
MMNDDDLVRRLTAALGGYVAHKRGELVLPSIVVGCGLCSPVAELRLAPDFEAERCTWCGRTHEEIMKARQ